MKAVALVGGLLCALALWAAPARAQEHLGGDGALSPDGTLLAFVQQGRPQGEFLVLEIASGRSFRFVMSAPLADVRHLSWAPASNTLVFSSLDNGVVSGAAMFAANPRASAIWSVAFTAEGPQPAKELARGEELQTPALSPDGSKLAYFEVVRLPKDSPERRVIPPMAAFGLFEVDLQTGAAARVAAVQYKFPRELYYDGADAWLINVDEAAYPTEIRGSQFWSATRPGAPGGAGSFDQLTGGIKSFRVKRGDALPVYPASFETYPAMGVAPLKSRLVGVTSAGEPILYGAPGPENTAANQQRNTASWYVQGIARVPMKEGYIAYRRDGAPEIYYPPPHPERYASITGGWGVDGAMKRFFSIRMTPYPTPDDFGLTTSRLFLYEGQSLLLERDVTDIIMKAEKVVIGD